LQLYLTMSHPDQILFPYIFSFDFPFSYLLLTILCNISEIKAIIPEKYWLIKANGSTILLCRTIIIISYLSIFLLPFSPDLLLLIPYVSRLNFSGHQYRIHLQSPFYTVQMLPLPLELPVFSLP